MRKFNFFITLLLSAFVYAQNNTEKVADNVKVLSKPKNSISQSITTQQLANNTANDIGGGIPTGNSQEVGYTEGDLSVNLTGAAIYRIPIKVPEGINGFTPEISITYNSQAGSGIAGYGWHIDGVSTITRIPSTKYHDGEIDPVDFDNLDRFALDGERLILKNGVYGGDGAEYETEKFSSVRVFSYGIHPNGTNYGPAYFIVYYPNGNTAYFGNENYSKNSMQWGITKLINPKNITINYKYIDFEYTVSGYGILVIDEINYGNNEENLSNDKIKIDFRFIPNIQGNLSHISDGGSVVMETKLLDDILISVNKTNNYNENTGIPFKKYKMDYSGNTSLYTGDIKLVSITEYGLDTNINSLIKYNPTTFTYNDTPNGVSLLNQDISTIPVSNINYENCGVIGADIDDYSDIDMILYPKTGSDSFSKYWVVTNVGEDDENLDIFEHNTGKFESIFPVTWLSWNNKVMPNQAWCVAKQDNLTYKFQIYSRGIVAPIYYQYERIVNFPTSSIGTDDPDCYTSISNDYIYPKQIISGDFNGDGLSDVIAIDKKFEYTQMCQIPPYDEWQNTLVEMYSKKVYFVDLNRNITTNIPQYIGELSNFLTDYDRLEIGDFDGDGKTDFFIITNGNVKVYGINSINQLTILGNYSHPEIYVDRIFLGDYDGDGKTDMLIPKTYGNAYNLFYSTGKSFYRTYPNLPISYDQNQSGLYGNTSYIIATDFNKDKKTDLIKVTNESLLTPFPTGYRKITAQFYKNNRIGHNYTLVNTTSTNYQDYIKNKALPVFFDTKKSGYQNQLSLITNNKVLKFKSEKDVSKERLLSKITLGNGNQTIINYSEFSEDFYQNNYYPSLYNELYPNRDIEDISYFNIVSKIENQTLGQYKKQLYRYSGAVMNFEGLGFLGFRAIAKTNWFNDEDSKIITEIRKFDLSKRGAISESFFVNGQVFNGDFYNYSPYNYISKTSNTYDYTLSPNKVFKLKNTNSLVIDNLNNTANEVTTEYDDYLNPIKINTIKKEGTTIIENSESIYQYYNSLNTQNYFIGRPKQQNQSITIYPNTPDEGVTTSEEKYFYVDNLLKKKEIKGHNTNTLIQEFEYDIYGNITQETLKANNLADRIIKYEFDDSKRFLKKIIDVEGLVKSYTHDKFYGNVLTKTDEYGLQTNIEYDKWGKVKKEEDYLGNQTIYTYNWLNPGVNGYFITTISKNDNSLVNNWFDDSGRKIAEGIKTINDPINWIGNISYVSYMYDIYDRVVKKSEPQIILFPILGEFTSNSQYSQQDYDNYGRVIKTIKPTGHVTTIEYQGLTTTYTNSIETIKSVKNGIGNIVEMTDNGGTIKYKYYANNNLKYSNYDGTIIKIEQDGWGRKTKLDDPNAGQYEYQYNNFGELIKEVTPNGLTEYEIDDYGKLKSKTIVGENTNSKSDYYYNPNSKLLESIYFIDNIEGHEHKHNFGYDSFKRLLNTYEETPFASFKKEYIYDGFGRIEIEKSSAKAYGKESVITTKNSYKNGYRYQLLDNSTNQELLNINNQNARGQLTSISLGNGISINNSYDQFGFPIQTKHYTQQSNIMTLDYGFDTIRGNLLNRYNSLFDSTEEFGYDEMDRLVYYPDRQGNIVNQHYDEKGRIKENNIGSYEYNNAEKQYQNTAVKLNDAEVEFYNQYPTLDISYNTFKSPVDIAEKGNERISFLYSPFNSRSTMYYGNEEEVKEHRRFRKHYSADGSIEIVYDIETGDTQFLNFVDGDAYSSNIIYKENYTQNNLTKNYYYLHRDYQGSILAITDANAHIVEKRHFDAWGNINKILDKNNEEIKYFSIIDRGYTGHEHIIKIAEGGYTLIHMNGRLYDAKLHRFLQPDNYVQDPYNTQNYNRYGYVLNNPLKYTDYSGENYGNSETPSGEFQGAVYANAVASAFHMIDQNWPEIKGFFKDIRINNNATKFLSNNVKSIVKWFENLFKSSKKEEVIPLSPNFSNQQLSSGWQNEGILSPNSTASSFQWVDVLDGLQTTLDVVGLVPGVGEIADGANALIYLARGDYQNAALSGSAMIPIAGWGATGAKLAMKADNAYDAYKVAKGVTANPFKGKTFSQIDEIFKAKGFTTKGVNPLTGKGSYFSPSGTRYYLDKGGMYKKGFEGPHVDIWYNGHPSFEKVKFFLDGSPKMYTPLR